MTYVMRVSFILHYESSSNDRILINSYIIIFLSYNFIKGLSYFDQPETVKLSLECGRSASYFVVWFVTTYFKFSKILKLF